MSLAERGARRHRPRRAAPRRLGRLRARAAGRARRRGGRPPARAARRRRRGRAPLRPRRRAARRPRRDRRGDRARDLVARAASRSGTPSTSYRWVLAGGETGYGWVNGAGLVGGDVADADDFVLSLAPAGPDWHLRVGRLRDLPGPVRLDRAAASSAPEWAIRRAWDEPPTGRGPATPHELYGGDLYGVEQHLDHVERLGANVVYLTPFFPAGSTHRYDAWSSTASTRCSAATRRCRADGAAHARGLRVVGDLTLNHCGSRPRLVPGARSPTRPRRSASSSTSTTRCRTATSRGSASAACRSSTGRRAELRARMAGVVRRWLEPPYELDGWRVDVAQHGRPLPRRRPRPPPSPPRRARPSRPPGPTASSSPSTATTSASTCAGDGWHGTMNYAGFLRPV